MTDDEILKRADEIRAARAETFRAEAAAVEARVQSLSTKGVTPEQPAFTDAEILKGDAARGTTHDGPFPFAFYSIKSEGQPSAQGATTRPQTEGAAA